MVILQDKFHFKTSLIPVQLTCFIVWRDPTICLHHLLSCYESRSDRLRPCGHNYILPTCVNSLHKQNSRSLIELWFCLIRVLLCLIVYYITMDIIRCSLPCFIYIIMIIMCVCHMTYWNTRQYSYVFLQHLQHLTCTWHKHILIIYLA